MERKDYKRYSREFNDPPRSSAGFRSINNCLIQVPTVRGEDQVGHSSA